MTMQDIKENRVLLACAVILIIAAIAGVLYYMGMF
jgi:hypothetical protein